MKSNPLLSTLILLVLFAFGSCTSQGSKQHPDKDPLVKPDVSVQAEKPTPAFPLPDVPIMITDPQEGAIYMSKHFWDLFPFTDTTLIGQSDITEQGFVDYIELLNNVPKIEAENSLQIMLDKAKAEPTMYRHFASLFEKYLYDPNSPFRNDELYIPVVNNLLKSGLMTPVKQEIYSFQQEMILKNRVGTKATDFVYTLANGDKKKMHALQSNYLILFISNPDCPTCATVTEALANSNILESIFSLNNSDTKMLTVLSIYPDSNIDEWRKALPNLPQKNWVNAYDDGTILTNKKLYDLKAIPSLYLLDKNKQIILKDTSFEEIEAYFMRVRGNSIENDTRNKELETN